MTKLELIMFNCTLLYVLETFQTILKLVYSCLQVSQIGTKMNLGSNYNMSGDF